MPVLVTSILLLSLFISCGSKNNSTDENAVRGPVITGSKMSGAYITMVTADLNISSNSLHYYNFGTGTISSVSSSEGRDPVAIWNQSLSTVVYLVRSAKTFRSFKVQNAEPVEAKSGSLSGLETGDPTAWHEAEPTTGTYLFANLHEKSLRSFESTSGYLSSPIDLSRIDLSPGGNNLSPIAMAGTSSVSWLISSGVDFSEVSPTVVGSGLAIKLEKDGESWKPADINSSTSNIETVTFSITHPTYTQISSSGDSMRVFGLCSARLGTACKVGAQDLNFSTGFATSLSDFKDVPYSHFSTIVSGSDEDTVYAHVTHTATNSQMVVKFNLKSGATKEIHAFANDSLSLLSYDKDSDRLFIGAKENQIGILNVYKAETLESKVTTKDIPWHAAFVSSI